MVQLPPEDLEGDPRRFPTMLQVSSSALSLLKDALEVERTDDAHVFRLDIHDDQFVLGLDEVKGDDVKYDHDGMAVLAAPREVASSLLGETTIDLESTEDGPRLVLLQAGEEA
jgi:hypothetical protein